MAPANGKWLFKSHKGDESAVCERSFKGIFSFLSFNREDVVSGSPPNYQFSFSTKLLSHLDKGISLKDSIKAGDRFRRASRKGKFKGDDRYISTPLNWGSFAKVVQVDETGITVDVITYNGQIKQLTLSEKEASQAKISRASKDWFERIEKAPDSVGPFDIPQFSEEEKYKVMGVRKIFYAGLNKVKRLKYLAKRLRESNINPFTTHIVDLVSFIDEPLEFIDRGIQEQGQNVSERQDILKDFKKEAQQKVENQKVSLYWFLSWNFRLIWLASLDNYVIADELAARDPRLWWLTDASWNKYLNENMGTMTVFDSGKKSIVRLIKAMMEYPDQIYLPFLDNLGVMTLNEAFADQDFVKQIINKEKMTDAIPMNPLEFEEHEMSHIRDFNLNQGNFGFDQKEKGIFSQFYIQWRKIRENFSPEKIEMVELIHSYLSREIRFEVSLTDGTNIVRALVRNASRFEKSKDLRVFLPPKMNIQGLGDYFETSAKIFSQIAKKFQADKERRARGWIFRR